MFILNNKEYQAFLLVVAKFMGATKDQEFILEYLSIMIEKYEDVNYPINNGTKNGTRYSINKEIDK